MPKPVPESWHAERAAKAEADYARIHMHWYNARVAASARGDLLGIALLDLHKPKLENKWCHYVYCVGCPSDSEYGEPEWKDCTSFQVVEKVIWGD